MTDFEAIRQNMLKHPDGEKMLTAAFTHRSYASENKLKYDNQRLEFLGDAVLELVISSYLFRRYPEAKEGELTALRSALVREETLARIARGLQIGNKLRSGKGERENQGYKRNSTLADLFEALVGAYYMTCGYDAAAKMVSSVFDDFYPELTTSLGEMNPKGKLQELTQHYSGKTPVYRVLRVSGPSHDPQYDVEVEIGSVVAPGSGKSRKDAEARAAETAYKYLRCRYEKLEKGKK